jgi:hypothetical protein
VASTFIQLQQPAQLAKRLHLSLHPLLNILLLQVVVEVAHKLAAVAAQVVIAHLLRNR